MRGGSRAVLASCLAVLMATLPAAAPPALAATPAAPVSLLTSVPGAAEVDPTTALVRFDRTVPPEARRRTLGRHGLAGAFVRHVGGTSYVEVSTRSTSRARMAELLSGASGVVAVDANLVRRGMEAPNDAEYQTEQKTYLELLRLPEAWDLWQGSTDTVIAIVDSGVDPHPDLVQRLQVNDATTTDVQGHGTQVAGVAAAVTGNGLAIAGAAHTATILPIRVLDEDNAASDAEVAVGIDAAVARGADVINLSLGGGGGSDGVLREAVARAIAAGIIVVAASGNRGGPAPVYPAAYPGVLAVGATTHDGALASLSGHGPWVDLVAPGIDIRTTRRLAGTDPSLTRSNSGTSFAVPLVAGVAALVRSRFPDWTGVQVADHLKATAWDVGAPGDDDIYGAGIVDAYAALTGELRAPRVAPPSEVPSNATPDRATLIGVGAPLQASISPEGDEDWYRIPAGGGDVDVVVTPPPDAGTVSFDPVLRVYDAELDHVETLDGPDAGEPESFSFRRTGADVYLQVENFHGTPSPAPYTLSVQPSGRPRTTIAGEGRRWIRDTSPPDDSEAIASDAPFSIRFGRDIDPATVGPATADLVDGRTGAAVATSDTFDAATDRLTLVPHQPLEAGRAYHLRVNGACEVQGAARLDALVVARFRVSGAPSDTVVGLPAPSVVGAPTPPTCPAPPPPPPPPPTTSTTSTTTTAPPPASPPAPGPPPAPRRSGYWMVGRDGAVYAFGDAADRGHVVGMGRGVEAVDLEPTPSSHGYWIVTNLGHVRTFGDAPALGGLDGAVAFGEAVTSLSRTSTGRGYWLFTTRGRVIAFGDAVHLGDMGAVRLNGPVLDSIPSPSGRGYYMVASDGGIFTFGDADFRGSMGGIPLNAPVQSLVPDADGSGYWLVASDGGIFSFDAPFRGSMGDVRLNGPITGMVRFGDGYLMVGTDGGIFTFSDREFHGSLGANPPSAPIVSVAAS